MVGTMLSMGIGLGFLAVILCEEYFPTGPPGLMRRLSDDEFEELRDFCKYPPINARRTVENRIIGGWYVNKTDFPKPTVAIVDAAGKQKCGATFITRRHLVTAAHCFNSLFHYLYNNDPKESKPEHDPPPYLRVGGVCIRETRDMCVATDTESQYIDYVIYATESGVDLAIIQLRKDQIRAEYHGSEFEPACIYGTYADEGAHEPTPKTVLGSDKLKFGYFEQVDVSNITQLELQGGMTEPIRDLCAKHPYVCMLPVQNKSLGASGDSGGSVYTRRGGRMYLAGVYTGQGAIFRRLTWPYPVTDYVHVTIDLLAFKSDFCHLLGLCIEGKSRSSSEPTLKWNSVYISEGRRQFGLVMKQGVAYYNGKKDDRSPAPFPIIGTNDREMMQGTCHGVRSGVRRRSDQLKSGYPWMAQLVDPDTKEVLCQAVLIVDFHAITHKKCFEDAKRREKKPLLYVGGICRPGKPNCEATEVLYNFAAWSSRDDRDLAIINIVEYTDPTVTEKTRGACFPLPKDSLANVMGLYGYDGGNRGTTDKLNDGIFALDRCEGKSSLRQFCLAPDRDQTSRQFYGITAADIGGAAIDAGRDIVYGLVVGREDDGTVGGRVVVADIRAHLDDICFYTNRCDHRNVTYGYTLQDITLFDQHFGKWSLPKEDKQDRRKIHRRKKHRKVHRRMKNRKVNRRHKA